jgi:signal transduction histidine kinase
VSGEPATWAAKRSAVLEERNRLAGEGEIHDGLAQSFTAICMANFGLAEARCFAHNLRLGIADELGLVKPLQRLVERSSVPGRLRCYFRSDGIPENNLPPRVRHELSRIAQEAIHNAMRHANPTTIAVTLNWDRANLFLRVEDNGSGITSCLNRPRGSRGPWPTWRPNRPAA